MNKSLHRGVRLLPSLLLVLSVVAVSCKQYVFDDLAPCARGVYINLYDQTECADVASYPALESVHVYAFDESGRLVSTLVRKDFTPAPDAELLISVPTAGRYSFVVWGNVSDQFFTLEDLKVGESSRQDVLMRLNRSAQSAVALGQHHLYVGATPVVAVGDKSDFFVHTKANLREITNRINVRVVGFEDPKQFAIELRSNNALYSAEGGIINDQQVIYPAPMQYLPNKKFPNELDLVADYSTLRLESGRSNDLIVRRVDTGEEIYKADLVGTILLSQNADNINLRCLNDYNVLLNVKKCNCPGGYSAINIWVNDWLVHSYEIDLGDR